MQRKVPGINRLMQFMRFFRVSRLLLWTIWVIYRERRRVLRARERGNYEVQPDVEVLVEVLVAFRQTALKLGVLMIKLGQFLSSRADLLPERALTVLTSLQDEVPPEPFEHVVAMLEADLRQPVEKVFRTLERECAAAASLGQVHKAILARTGETVAVKVQRPHLDLLVRSDLSTLKFVIWLVTRFVDPGSLIDLWGFYREFRRTVFEEMDFAAEATNALRFREMFQHDPTVYIPKVYEEYVTRHVMVLEWIDGIKINDYAALKKRGVDRLEVAKRTVNAYFHQFFEAGFFHADPHPGNIFVKSGSSPSSPVIAFIDFGMVGSITRHMKRSMRELFLGAVTRDAHMIANALSKLGFLQETANMVAVERALSLLLDQYYGMTLGELRDMDMSEIAQDVVELLYGQPFHIPAQFAFSGRAVSTLVGVITGLAPDFDFVKVATPYARHFLGLDASSAGETATELARQLLDTARVVTTLPRSVERLITRIEAGQIEVRLANLPLGRQRRRGRNQAAIEVPSTGGRLTLLLAFLGSLAGGVYLTSAHLVVPGWFCLTLAGVTALGMVLKR